MDDDDFPIPRNKPFRQRHASEVAELVERLRSLDLVASNGGSDAKWTLMADAAMQEAADMIERLDGALRYIAWEADVALGRSGTLSRPKKAS